MDDEGAVDDVEGFSNVVIRNKHPESPSGKLAHQFANITDRNGINPGEGFIKEDEIGVCGKRAGNLLVRKLNMALEIAPH